MPNIPKQDQTGQRFETVTVRLRPRATLFAEAVTPVWPSQDTSAVTCTKAFSLSSVHLTRISARKDLDMSDLLGFKALGPAEL